jgi:hypothetical protein
VTFSEIQTEVLDRLGMTSSTDSTRIGRAINRRYKEITTSLGIKQTSRLTLASKAVTIAQSTVDWTAAEKVIAVYNRAVTPYVTLEEVSMEELRSEMPFQTSDSPTKWATQGIISDIVTILINVIPATGFTLYADTYATASTLSGSNEPAFPESYHDILISAVLVDELLKLEKAPLAVIENSRVTMRLGELRHWFAVSLMKEQYQGTREANRSKVWM